MRLVGLILGELVVLVSAITFVAPDLRLSFERSLMTPTGLMVVAAERMVVGLAFVFAASASRTPRTVRALGLILIVAGLTTPWFGADRAQRLVSWLAAEGSLPMRLDACVGMALGGFLVYVFRTPHAKSV
jgi:hypothetical protein